MLFSASGQTLGSKGGSGGGGSFDITLTNHDAPSNASQPSSGTLYYNRLVPGFSVKGITKFRMIIASQSQTVTFNMGIYDSDGNLLRSTTLTTSGSSDGAVFSETFAELDIVRCTTYWLAITYKTGNSVSFASLNTNTSDSFAKSQSIQSPYDLPATMGSTSQTNNYFQIAVCGKIA